MDYSLGFLFSHDFKQVVLIKKNKPAWQSGKLNGVGGKIESGETPLQAMIREFEEETGVTTLPDDWCQVGTMLEDGLYKIAIFAGVSSKVNAVTTTTSEVVVRVNLEHLVSWNVVENIKWIIPMCIEALETDGNFYRAEIF